MKLVAKVCMITVFVCGSRNIGCMEKHVAEHMKRHTEQVKIQLYYQQCHAIDMKNEKEMNDFMNNVCKENAGRITKDIQDELERCKNKINQKEEKQREVKPPTPR